jgi:hypothetical protein
MKGKFPTHYQEKKLDFRAGCSILMMHLDIYPMMNVVRPSLPYIPSSFLPILQGLAYF